MVVSTPDAVLVVPRARAQEVRELVAKLKDERRPEATDHRRVHRPWGYYDSIDRASASRSSASWCIRAARCRCRSITIAPSTGWWCAAPPRSRSASDVKAVHENESIYIPIGAVHRLANRGKIPLELIEVQTGSYLGEDDIVRIEDVYKRN